MRARIGIIVLASVTACRFDASGGGGTSPVGVAEDTSGGPEPGSTSRGDTTAAASTGVGVDGTTLAEASTGEGATTTTTEGGSSSSSGEAVLEVCDDVDNDGDGAIDEPSPANLACDDCTSILLGDVAFTTCTAEASWEDARARCMMLGGDLASFDELDEQQTVVASGSGDRWIGLTDAAREDTWTWADGSALDYQDWRANEPDDGGPGEDCGQIRGIDEGWGDARCASERDYVCEVTVE